MNDLGETSSNCNMDSSSMTSIIEEELVQDNANLIHVPRPGPVMKMRIVDNAIGLSPMSEITFLVSDNLVLTDSSVSTPTTAKGRSRFNGE
ncbi:unnamed protein product [Diamesa serratosioi]